MYHGPSLVLVFQIVALVLFAFEGVGVPQPKYVHCLGWGLFFWLLSTLSWFR
jgi:hypothetical protein